MAAFLLVGWWIRAIRLRMILCEPHPRELLFGALRERRVWVRAAALAGLPSSMWTAPALRRSATWALLLSRPIVYLGAFSLAASVPIGVALLAAGHALFIMGKRLAARVPWRPGAQDDARPPVLFLRSFHDDQFNFARPWWQLRRR